MRVSGVFPAVSETTVIQVLVPTARLELAQLSPLPPQDSVSTNSTTSAVKSIILAHIFSNRQAQGRLSWPFPVRRPGHWILLGALQAPTPIQLVFPLQARPRWARKHPKPLPGQQARWCSAPTVRRPEPGALRNLASRRCQHDCLPAGEKPMPDRPWTRKRRWPPISLCATESLQHRLHQKDYRRSHYRRRSPYRPPCLAAAAPER